MGIQFRRLIRNSLQTSLVLSLLVLFTNCTQLGDGFVAESTLPGSGENPIPEEENNTSPTPTPVPTPTPPLVDQATKDAMTAIVAGQTATSHEAAIPDVRFEWHRGPGAIMQSPAKADIPDWFEHSKPDWCYVLNSWMQVFEAEGNTATNTRVQYRNMKIYVLSETTKTWSLLKNDAAPWTDTWEYPFVYSANGGLRNEASGGVSFKPDYPYFAHGYGTHSSIVPQDIRAVFVSMDTRLVLEDAAGVDDRASARYLVNVGADYWPNEAAVNTTWPYAPGVGQGRFILATTDWRKATMLVPNGRYGSSMQEMIDTYPPPLD